jgi:hypothetical protein
MDKRSMISLAEALLEHAEKVRTMAEFLKIKQDALRPGDEVSFFGHYEAKRELTLEAGLLSGHLLMVKEEIARRRRTPDTQVRQAIRRVSEVLNSVALYP